MGKIAKTSLSYLSRN